MDKDFLHSINIDDLQKEVGMDIQGISDYLGIDVQNVYRWSWIKSKNGNRPKYNTIIKLLQKGASVKTLFGVNEVPSSVNYINERKAEKILSKSDAVDAVVDVLQRALDGVRRV